MLNDLTVIGAASREGDRVEDGPLSIDLESHGTVRLSSRWLRLACECDVCGDSRSGKRWITPADVDSNIRPYRLDRPQVAP